MSDATENDEIKTSVEQPAQAAPTDTSNQDNKVSTDPAGEKYIRTAD